MTVCPELILEDDADDTGVFINPLTSQYVYDAKLDIEFVIVAESTNAFGDDPFNIIAAKEESLGCPMALH